MRPEGTIFSTAATFALALLLTLAFANRSVFAADGDLDLTFDGDGKVITDFNGTIDYARDVAIQPDGKIVAVGTTQLTTTDFNFSIARYNANGSLDSTFGANGKITTSLSNLDDAALSVAIQPDGKIVAGGYCQGTSSGTNQLSALVRYNTDGSLDSTFGNAGKVCGSFANSQLTGLVVQPDGKIVSSGNSSVGTAPGFGVIRWNANGTPDNTFGVQGIVTTNFFGGRNEANDVALQPDGKILVAGKATVSATNADFALARYLNNGSLDATFDGDGLVTTDLTGRTDFARSIALTPNGKIILAGAFTSLNSDFDFGMARYNSNGSLDTTFDSDGKVEVPIVSGLYNDYAEDVAVQPADGKVVAVGNIVLDIVPTMALLRVNANGTIDTAFGTDGRIFTDFNVGDAYATTLALQTDGKIVASASVGTGTNNDNFALARFLSPLLPTATPTSTRTSTSVVTPTSTPTACPIEFTDVPVGSTYYETVHCLACRGVMSGFSSGCSTGNPCFKPETDLIRGDLAKAISNASGFTETYSTSTFQDVPTTSSYFQFVERVASRSIMSGFSCGGVGEPCVAPQNRRYFRPGSKVTRGDFAKTVATALNMPAPQLPQSSFEDVPTNHPYWRWIEALRRARLIGGFPCGGAGEPCVAPQNRPYFRPSSNITRGDASITITLAYFPECAGGIRK